jgi:hypothetical protein
MDKQSRKYNFGKFLLLASATLGVAVATQQIQVSADTTTNLSEAVATTPTSQAALSDQVEQTAKGAVVDIKMVIGRANEKNNEVGDFPASLFLLLSRNKKSASFNTLSSMSEIVGRTFDLLAFRTSIPTTVIYNIRCGK